MRAQLVAAVRAVVVFTVLVGVAYPLAVTGVAQVAFDDEADGSLVARDGRLVGSRPIGQPFEGEERVHPALGGRRSEGALATQLGGEADDPEA